MQVCPPTTVTEVLESIFEYLDRLFRIVRPRRLLYLAVGWILLADSVCHVVVSRAMDAVGSWLASFICEILCGCTFLYSIWFLCADGVAPCAKMNRMRRGRFHSAWLARDEVNSRVSFFTSLLLKQSTKCDHASIYRRLKRKRC